MNKCFVNLINQKTTKRENLMTSTPTKTLLSQIQGQLDAVEQYCDLIQTQHGSTLMGLSKNKAFSSKTIGRGG